MAGAGEYLATRQASTDGNDPRTASEPSDPVVSEVVIVRSARVLILALGSSAVLVSTALPAGAYPFGLGAVVPVSGPSPFAGCTVGAAPPPDPGTVYPDTCPPGTAPRTGTAGISNSSITTAYSGRAIQLISMSRRTVSRNAPSGSPLRSFGVVSFFSPGL